MSDVVMITWECAGCGDGGDGPCISYGVYAPHACPYGTEENMVWEAVGMPQNIEEVPKTSINSAMDAIAALKNLVSAIDRHNSNPEYVHAPWVRECKELSHARSVLQQHQ